MRRLAPGLGLPLARRVGDLVGLYPLLYQPFPHDERPWELLVDTSNDRAEEQRVGGELTGIAPASLKLFFRRRRP